MIRRFRKVSFLSEGGEILFYRSSGLELPLIFAFPSATVEEELHESPFSMQSSLRTDDKARDNKGDHRFRLEIETRHHLSSIRASGTDILGRA